MSLSRPRSQLNTLQSSHNHHHQRDVIGWNFTVQNKTSQVEERKKKTSCEKFNILLRNQQKPLSASQRLHCARSFGGNQTRETRRQTHKKWGRHNTVWQDNGRMQPRCGGVLPLDAVKSIATVKLSCVLVGDWARQRLLETEMQGLSQRLQMGAHSQLFFHEWAGGKKPTTHQRLAAVAYEAAGRGSDTLENLLYSNSTQSCSGLWLFLQ